MSTKKDITNVSHNKTKKVLKSKKNSEYYLIHCNGGRPIIVTIHKNVLKVYKNIYIESILSEKEIKTKNLLKFTDYTDDNKTVIYSSSKELFKINNLKKIFIGYDVNPRNNYIKNRKFGLGNTILFFDGLDYFLVYFDSISKIKGENIIGRFNGFISPIGNNDVPNPIIFTSSHIYCFDNITNLIELKIPNQKNIKKIIKILCKCKGPYNIPKKHINDINDLYSYILTNINKKYKTKIKITTILKV